MHDRHSTVSRTHAAQMQQRIHALMRGIADREQRGENVESTRKLLRIVDETQRTLYLPPHWSAGSLGRVIGL